MIVDFALEAERTQRPSVLAEAIQLRPSVEIRADLDTTRRALSYPARLRLWNGSDLRPSARHRDVRYCS